MVKFVRKKLYVHYYTNLPTERRLIEEFLKVRVPGAEFSPSYRDDKWDGYYRLYEKRFSRFRYGHLQAVKTYLDAKGIKYTTEGDFTPLHLEKLQLREDLWQHQKESILQYSKCPYGIFEIPTRGGKTMTASEIIRLADFDYTLFVVDNQVLFEQVIKDLSKNLHISESDIGRIMGEEFQIESITVAMIQTLQSIKHAVKKLLKSNKKNPRGLEEYKQMRYQRRTRAQLLDEYMKKVDFVIVDEVHEYNSDDRQSTIFAAENAKAYLFLSATPNKSEDPVGNIKRRALMGSTVYKVEQSTLKARGILAQEQILLFSMNHAVNRNILVDDESGYQTYEEQIIIRNQVRNTILVNVTNICRQIGLKTIVLFSKREHARFVQQITGDVLLTGETKLNQRLAELGRFLKHKGGVLLATNIFNKGITMPEVQIEIIAGGGLEQSQVIQKKGRTLGTTADKKKALIVDFIDNSEYFNEHSLSRIAVYEEHVGIDNIFIYDANDPDFYNDVREFLSVWKRG